MKRWVPILLVACASAATAQPRKAAPAKDIEPDKALEDAFGPPTPPPQQPKTMDGDVPPPSVVAAAPLTPEEIAENDFDARLQAATTDEELKLLQKEAKRLGPLWVLKIAERRVTLAPSKGDLALQWMNACGPGVPKERHRCHTRAVAAIAASSGQEAKDAPKLKSADECVLRAEKGGESGCLQAAIATYKKARDKLMVLRATLAQDDDLKKRSAALKLCSEPRCGPLRADVLDEVADHDLAAAGASQEIDTAAVKGNAKKVEAALRLALQAVKLRQASLLAGDRVYARSKALDLACVAYEVSAGKGKCRSMEQRVLGAPVFRDFSARNAAGPEGLSSQEARTATDHFSVLLIPCLVQHGERSGSGRYKISWTILNDGRVTNVKVVNVNLKGPLMSCVKDQFTRWRYPKYKGELQHMDQEFTVTAMTR